MPCSRASLSVTSGSLFNSLLSCRNAPSYRVASTCTLVAVTLARNWSVGSLALSASDSSMGIAAAYSPAYTRRQACRYWRCSALLARQIVDLGLQLIDQPGELGGVDALGGVSPLQHGGEVLARPPPAAARQRTGTSKRFRPAASAGRKSLRTVACSAGAGDTALATVFGLLLFRALRLAARGPCSRHSCWHRSTPRADGAAAARMAACTAGSTPACASSCASCSPVSDCSREL